MGGGDGSGISRAGCPTRDEMNKGEHHNEDSKLDEYLGRFVSAG